MPRPPRNQYPGAVYHVMNRGAARRITFDDDGDRSTFIAILGDTAHRHGVDVLAYCLMANHYHLVVRTPTGDLDRAMHRLKATYVRRYNRRHGRDGPLFRGRYHALLVESDEYLLQLVRYVHRNALAMSAAEDLLDYRWSSHGSYVGITAEPSWLETGLVLGMFRNDRRSFEEFVLRPDPAATTSVPARRIQAPSVVTVPPSGFEDPRLRDIDTSVCVACGLPEGSFATGGRGRTNLPRAMAIALARSLGVDNASIASHYHLSTNASIRSITRQFHQRLASDDDLRSRHDRARSLIEPATPEMKRRDQDAA